MTEVATNPLFREVVWIIDNWKKLNKELLFDVIYNAPTYYKYWWTRLLLESPEHVIIETALIVFIIWLVFIRRTVDPGKASKNEKLKPEEVQMLLDTWEPEPLVPALTERDQFIVDNSPVITNVNDDYTVQIEGISVPVMNVSSYDFLGLSTDPDVKKATKDALNFYGCGSCGPRGFYGTIDQHLFFEEAIAKFTGVQEAISYSDSASAVSSVIPAFSKKGDFLLVDDMVSEAVRAGINLSRSTVQFFKHNDMEHLRSIMESMAEDDKQMRRDPTQQRRFIVTEGLFRYSGDICPLPEIMALKAQYCYRLILDESLSFGTLGATGRGVTEHFKINIEEVEVLTISMDTVLASVGGLCIGNREVVDHQRLSGAGYCFSASAPPFLSAAAVAALATIEREPQLISDLHKNTQLLYDGLTKGVTGLQIKSDDPTPLIHLELVDPLDSLDKEQMVILRLAKRCLHQGIGVSASKFTPTMSNRPSIMICASSHMTKAMITKIVKVLEKELKAELKELKASR